MVIVNGGVSLGCIKFIAEARAKDSKTIILAIFKYFQAVQIKKLLLYAIFASSIIYLFGDNIIENTNRNIFFVLIIASMIKTYHMYCISVLKGFEDFRALALVTIIISPLNLILILSCYITNQPLETYLWIYLIISLAYLIVSYPLLRIRINELENDSISSDSALKKRMSHHLKTTSWISILGFIVLRQSELFFLNIYSTPEDMAYYNVGYSLAFASMALVPGVYSAILLPLMSRENKKGNNQAEAQLKISLRYMFQLIIALIFPICFFAEDIFRFLYGAQYLDAVFPFQIILVCISLKTLSDCTNAYLLSKDQQALILKLIVAACLLTLSLDYYFIKEYRLFGALTAISISTLFLGGSYMYFAIKCINMKGELFIYSKSTLCGIASLLMIYPIGVYMSNIIGVIIGVLIYIVFYSIMLIITVSIGPDDINVIKKANQRYLGLKVLDTLLTKVQKKAANGRVAQ